VILLSDSLWAHAFGRDPSVIGRRLTLDGQSYTVIGVLPSSHFHPSWRTYDAFTSLGRLEDVLGGPTRRGEHPGIYAYGRLKPDVRKSNDAYVCFYTSYYAGGAVKTPLGSGMYAAKSVDDVAANLLASMAQDVVERWNSTMRNNAIKIMESCLSPNASCAVPVPPTPELRTKVLNLAQSLKKGELNK